MKGSPCSASILLAFLPRILSRELFPLAEEGAAPERLIDKAKELDPSGAWIPPPELLTREAAALESGETELVRAGEKSYPSLLRQIADPPLCLHVRGELPDFRSPAVAIVGSRTSVGNSVSFTKKLAHDLAAAGVTIVSGMARGIDSAAHAGCLDDGFPTVAVLGCGADICYPRENRKLMKRIIARGAIVSEYPMGTPPRAFHFPARNRIISGCCLGAIVVEAGRTSGALVTAKFAMEQNRAVFAVPGAVWNPLSSGPNDLLRDGAIPVRGADDVLEEIFGIVPRAGMREKSTPPVLGRPERDVLGALDYDEARHIDTVARLARVPAARALTLLLDLEMKGLANQLKGKRFLRVGRGA